MYGDLTSLIVKLATRECGCHSSNQELRDYTTSEVCNAANKLVTRGVLFKAKLAHKEARYYADQARAQQVERNAAFSRKVPRFGKAAAAQHRHTQRLDWLDADMVVTPDTVFTQCPNYSPRFQAVDTPNVYGGNQRGRVVL